MNRRLLERLAGEREHALAAAAAAELNIGRELLRSRQAGELNIAEAARITRQPRRATLYHWEHLAANEGNR